MPSKSIARRFVDVTQKARGRTALRYEFEIIPYFAGEIPQGVDRVLFAWERGSKLYVTDAEPVNPNTRAVFWKQYLKQQTTVYKDGDKFVAKEFSFKIQSFKQKKDGEEERSTIGKLHIDLAQFCHGQTDPAPEEKFLQLKPHGKLKVSIKASWLKDAKIEPDAMTEVSAPSQLTGFSEGAWEEQEEEEEYTEQDLSGFDHPEASSSHGYGEDGGSRGSSDRRKKSRRKGHKSRSKDSKSHYPDEIPEGFEGRQDYNDEQHLHGEDDEENGHHMHEDGNHHQLSADAHPQGHPEAGMQLHKPSWKDYVCCCCMPRRPQVLEPQEVDMLLSKKQAVEMQRQNQYR